MKKWLTLACVALASGSLYAEVQTFLQTIPWTIRDTSTKWYIANASGTVNVSFTNNSHLASRPTIASDVVTLLCDKEYKVQPGQTVKCRMTDHVRAEFRLAGNNFKNGAEGSYTTS